MVQLAITIPRYRLVDEPPEKAHYVYVVEVIDAGRTHRVERRYSAFHYLHRELRKCFSTPLFPPKRVRSFQPKVLERRRLSLEQYLQTMARYGPSREQVLAFLGVRRTASTPEISSANVDDRLAKHQPIYQYNKDPYLTIEEHCNLPDVVTRGVFMALYE